MNSPCSWEERCCRVQAGQKICPLPNPWTGSRIAAHEQAASSSRPSRSPGSLTADLRKHRSNAQARSNPIGTAVCSDRKPPFCAYIQAGRRKGRRPSRPSPSPSEAATWRRSAWARSRGRMRGRSVLRFVCLPLGMCTAAGFPPLVYCGSDEKNSPASWWYEWEQTWSLELGEVATCEQFGREGTC
jgi:hypothetical protein